MAVSAHWYGQGVKGIVTGLIDLDSDTFKGMLVQSGYTPDIDADDYRDDVAANEVPNGSGYTTGGVSLTSLAVTYDVASHEARWDFDDPQWISASFTCRYLVIYKSRGGLSSADELVMYIDFGSDETVASGTFTYQVPINGAGKFTVS